MRILMIQDKESSFYKLNKNNVYEVNDLESIALFKSFIDDKIAIELKGIKIPFKMFFKNINKIIKTAILTHNEFFKKEYQCDYGSGYIEKNTYNIFTIEIYGERYRIDCFQYNIQEELLEFGLNHWCLDENIANKLTNNILELLNLKN